MTGNARASFMKLIPNLSEIDRKAVLQAGIPAAQLMETAGGMIAKAVETFCEPLDNGVVICGPGNNGGDGFVCARKLQQAGFQHVSVIFTGGRYQQESLTNFEQLMGLPIKVIDARNQTDLALFRIRDAAFVVDALFGSGLSWPIEGLEAQLIEAINQRHREHQAWVLAVDIPSGIDGVSGKILGAAVEADRTVTFAAAKPGLYLFPGKAHAGEVELADIGIPPNLIEEDESPIRLITPETAYQWLPVRQAESHKYSYGHLLVVAGSKAMPGAAQLCTEAAMRSGAGLVTLASPESALHQLRLLPEILRLPLGGDHLGKAALSDILKVLPGKYAGLLIGPGLGQEPETFESAVQLVEMAHKLDLPVVIDADGLNALAQHGLPFMNERFILTPHVGECARLLETDNASVQSDLLAAAEALRAKSGANVVLKSAATVIATADGLLWISPTGNPGMATAGSGDVLSGIIAAMAVQRQARQLSIPEAAPLGVYLHGLSGDAAVEEYTTHGLHASVISHYLPNAFKEILNPAE